MIVIVGGGSEERSIEILHSHGEEAYLIGEITTAQGDERIEIING